MIKASEFREALGLTQEETAMLLRISMSQLSMFEIGQRSLPASKTIKLVTMYNYVQEKQQEKWEHPVLKEEEARTSEMLEMELQENQLQQLILKRKINNSKNKYQKNLLALQLADYFETQVPNPEKHEKEVAEMIRAKAISGIEKNGLTVQMKWNLKLNTLQLHQKELKRELERYKISNAP